MKKFSFLLMALFISLVSFADTYTYTFEKNVLNTSGGSADLGGVTWNYPSVGYVGFDGNTDKGFQLGSGSKPATDFTLSAIIPGEIQSITVNAATAKSATANLKVTVGDTEYINSALTTSSTDYTGTGNSSGEIKINFTQTTSKALYIKTITVVYNPSAGGPVKEAVVLTWSASTCDAILGSETEFPTLSITPEDLTGVTYSSSNADVATINATTGVIELVGGGTTNIVATFAETDDYYAAEAKYTLNVLAITEDTWVLVTDASTLAVDDQIIIVAEEYDVAMSTTQNSNNRGVAIVIKDENTVKATPQVQVFTLETGAVEGTFAFNTGEGYIYAASAGSNHLKTENAISDNSSWTISVSDTLTSIVATASTNRNVMQYNQSSNLFSCYASATQKPITVYKKQTAPAEPEYEIMDVTMTNLEVTEMGDVLVLTASDDANTGLNVMLAVDSEGKLTSDSYLAIVQGWMETELPVVEGTITKTYSEELATDVYSGLVVVEYMEGKLGLNLTMYSVPVEVIDVVIEDATITVEELPDGLGGTYELVNISAQWGESTLLLEGLEKQFEGFIQITEAFLVDGVEDWYIWMCMNGTVTTVDNVITVTGEFKNNFTGSIYNVTISGALPVVEPTTITWELNGGEFPTVEVPTNAELWEIFKPYYNEYYNLARADQPIDKVSTFAAAKMQEIMTDAASEYKWLGDYVLNIAAGQGVNLPTDMAAANEGAWRWAVHAFFNATTGANGAAGTDFTEAGKPENWGPAYQAAKGAVVLPTEPVEADYTLPTPTKTGYEFVGWYDNAEGAGEAMTVLPAGWAGTIYAIWKESATTSVENNIIVEQAVKVIRNGQVLIVIGDKTFNIMGQQVK